MSLSTAELIPTKTSLIFVVGNLGVSGPNLQLSYLVGNLDHSRFCVKVIVLGGNQLNTRIGRLLAELGCQVSEVGGTKLRAMFMAPWMLRRTVKQCGVAVLHSYGLRGDLVCAISGFRPRIASVRNNLRYNYIRRFGFLGRVVSFVNEKLLRTSDAVIACSDAVQENIQDLGIPSICVRNSIDFRIYQSLMCSGGRRRTDGECEGYLTVSSGIPGKNIEFLLDFFARNSFEQRRLFVMGYVDQDTSERYGGCRNIVFLGHCEHPGDHLSSARYFISASEHEGLPNAVIEALACGKPLILSGIRPHKEILELANDFVGTIFDPDFMSLSDALKRIESEDYLTVSANCTRLALEEFSSSKMSAEFSDVYKRVS